MLTPFLHHNEPSRESIFCGKVGSWWAERALIMLNFLLKTVQKMIVAHTRAWEMARKTPTLTTASSSGCRACCSRPTEIASWKYRSNLPLTASFQFVYNVLNSFRQATSLRHNCVLPQLKEVDFHFLSYLCPLLCTWEEGVYLGFTAKRP